MTATSYQRGRRGEQWLEGATGATRTRNRPRYVRAPDFAPLHHEATGEALQFESKHGANAEPKKVRDAIEQARGYTPGCIPIAVFRNVGSTDAIACLPLADLCRLLGLGTPQRCDAQLVLARSAR